MSGSAAAGRHYPPDYSTSPLSTPRDDYDRVDLDNWWRVIPPGRNPGAVYVVDIETTGLRGCPEDKIVEVGIARVSLTREEVRSVWSSRISYPGETLPENAWIFTHPGASLTPEEVQRGLPYQTAVGVVRGILDGDPATSYNREFDFDRFLDRRPWEVMAQYAPCIMKAAAKVPGIPCGTWSGCPTCECAYNTLCPDDPAHIGGHEDHRALSDAMVAGHILLALHRRGLYDLDEVRA